MTLPPDGIHAVHRQVHRLRRYSDRLIGIGPFGIGLDGVLAWVPVAGTVYSAGAGAWLLAQTIRASAAPATIARMVAYLAADTASSSVPILGYAIDTLFPGHLMAANALLKDIERRHPTLRPQKTVKPARAPKFRPAR